ncbi:MAG: hypothetical protein ACRCTZ_01220 [Sarcina sp.]
MFWDRKKIDLKDIDNTHKIALIHNGSSAELIDNIVKCNKCIIVFAPNEKLDSEFISDYNTHRDKNDIVTKDVYDIENRSANIDDYVFIHKADYLEYLKFKNQSSKKYNVDSLQQQQIKDRYLELKSQRKVAKEFGISLSVVNRILNDKY